VTSTISDVKEQLGEAFKRIEEVTGLMGGVLSMIEEAQAMVLAATDGSVNRAVEQMTGALIEARERMQESLGSIGAAVREAQDYSDSL
jgi:hypothetical protein